MAPLKEEIKAGIILLTSLILLSGFIILIGGGQFFEKLDYYHLKVMDAAGLEVGAQVRLGGVRVGKVLSITGPQGPGQPIIIEIGLKKGTVLYKGTQGLITQVGFVGDVYLFLSVDKTTNERIRVGETIPSEEQVQFARILAKVNDLSTSIDGVIKDVDRLFSQKNVKGIEQVIENTNKTVVSASSSLDQIASTLKGTADKLELVLDEIGSFVRENRGEISLVMQKAKGMIEKAEEEIEKAGEMIQAFEGTANTLSATLNSASKSVDKTILSIDKTMMSVDQLILSVDQTFTTADQTLTSVDQTLTSVGKTFTSVDQTVKSVDKAIGFQSQNLDQLLNRMIRTTEDLQELILEIKAKPWGIIHREGKGREE